MTLIPHPEAATVYAPDVPRAYEPTRPAWSAPAPLTVTVLLHAPAYLDTVPAGSFKPRAMQGGVGRETAEPAHGQVARLSQWDFGLTTGVFRLLRIADRIGVPVAVALDALGSRQMPGMARAVAARAGEIVVRGEAANVVLSAQMDEGQERGYVASATATVAEATEAAPVGWFSPERASTPRTTAILAEAGFRWFGDWPLDEVPVPLHGPAAGLTSVPFSLDAEDMFALYARGLPFADYERLLEDTVDQLVEDAASTGPRLLGLSWFGWVLGQACFADVAERTLARLDARSDVRIVLPSELAGV